VVDREMDAVGIVSASILIAGAAAVYAFY